MDNKPRILVVDDYRTMSRIIRNLLKQLGFDQVEEAADAMTALAALRAERFDLVIAEWNMQPVSGSELLRLLRSEPELAGLPVIMVTAERSIEDVTAGEETGPGSYIVKPFNAEMLSAKIQAVLCA